MDTDWHFLTTILRQEPCEVKKYTHIKYNTPIYVILFNLIN